MQSVPFAGQMILILVIMLFTGLLTLWETAVRGLNEAVLRKAAEEDDDRDAARLLPVAEKAEQYLNALRCEQVLCVLLQGVLADKMIAACYGAPGGWLALLSAMLVLLLVLLLIRMQAESIYPVLKEQKRHALARQGKAVAMLLLPAAMAAKWITEGVLTLFGLHAETANDEASEENIRAMVDIGGELGTIEEDEKKMIENVFEFNNRLASDIMIHRTDTVCLWAGESNEEVLHMIRENGLTRYPVYESDMDDIIGILNARDYLLQQHQDHPRPIRSLLRPAYFVPGTIQADKLFADMQKNKIHMAVVVDEYGGMSGIVTMEDLLEEIVGNIYDEFDPQAEAETVRLQDNLWRISGTARLQDIQQVLGIELPVEEYDTLGGLVFGQLTTIPVDGSRPQVEAAGLHIRVERLLEHRIESALVSIVQPLEPKDENE